MRAFYSNIQFEKYILDKCLADSICEVHPVLAKLKQVEKTEAFLKDLLKEKNKNNSLDIDESLETILQGHFPR